MTCEYWSDLIEAVEVLNSGSDQDSNLPFWPTSCCAASGSPRSGHSHFAGSAGLSASWIQADFAGTDAPLATRSGRAGWCPRSARSSSPTRCRGSICSPASLRVEARSASWVQVDRLRRFENGTGREVVEGVEATFALSPAADAIYWVVAEGDVPMEPVSGARPWALAGPWRVDADGDGFEPPLPPLRIEFE